MRWLQFFHNSMIIDNLDFVRVSINPLRTDSPLPVDSNAVLPSPVTLKGFQSIARWNP